MMNRDEAYIFDRDRNEEITKDVSSITVAGNGGYLITFNNGSKSYPYKKDRILYLKGVEEKYSPDTLYFASGRQITHIEKIVVFGDIYRFVLENGKTWTVEKKNLVKVRNLRRDKGVSDIISYLIEVSSYDEALRLEEGNDTTFLEKELENLTVREDSAAALFLTSSSVPSHPDSGPVIAPFSSNESQLEAIRRALDNTVSVIEGPPGTGKTQTILNIIANLLIRGKTIAVVSGNNEATGNVYEKLEKEGLGELAAELGSRSKRELFFSRPHSKDELRKKLSPFTSSPPENTIRSLEKEVKDIYRSAVRKAVLEEAINGLRIEEKERAAATENSTHLPRFCADSMSERDALKYSAYIETLYSARMPSLIRKMKMFFWFGFWPKKNFSPNAVVDFLQNRYYREKIRECREEIDRIEKKYPKETRDRILEEFRKESERKLMSHLLGRYRALEDKTFSATGYRNDSDFLIHYPIVLSTTFSLQNSKPKSVLFDYVIIDESSQVNLTSALPSLAAAKNAVIVGDSKQLPHVIESKLTGPLDAVRKKYSLPPAIDYRRYSLLESIKKRFESSLPSTLLNEHYRCDREIIGFCNRRFYNGELVIQTGHRDGNGMILIESAPHSAHGRMNEKQVKIITDEILPKIENRKDVGITAPYRAQVELIRERVNDSSILTDTVHKFQGKERSNMILSTVSDRTTVYPDSERTDFLNNPNLINVAVSRAKDRLYVISTKEAFDQKGTLLGDLAAYCRYIGGERKVSSVYSVFDLMYSDYSKVLEPLKKKLLKVSAFDSENIVWTLLKSYCSSLEFGPLDVLFNYPLRMIINTSLLTDEEDIAFVENANTHSDFVVYSTLDKEIRLIIEVDGKQHEGEIQRRRDERKDRILRSANLRIIRIKTTQVDVEEKIKDALRNQT